MPTGSGAGAWPCRSVWLNQYSSQLLPIVALVALRVFVGLGDAFLRLVTKPKKDPMQASSQCISTMPWRRGCSSRTAARAVDAWLHEHQPLGNLSCRADALPYHAQELAEEFGRHRAREFNVGVERRDTGVRFEDVAGIDDVKADIEEVMKMILGDAEYRAMGARPPRVCSSPGHNASACPDTLCQSCSLPTYEPEHQVETAGAHPQV